VRKTLPQPPFLFWHEIGLATLLVGVLLVARALDPSFLAADTQAELLTHVWEAALLAVPMTLVILTGGIDLSVGSTMALSAVTLGIAFRAGWPLAVALLASLLVGAVAGALNGVFVARLRVHPLLVTLATLAAYRGIAEGISQGEPVSGFPATFTTALTRGAAGLTPAGILFLVTALIAAFVLARTTWGLYLYAAGNNEEATRFSGVNVAQLKMLLYTLNGLAAAVAGILFVARRNTAKADIGLGLELEVITMVVLGGTSIFGGRGGIVGTVLGVLLLHETREFVSWQWHRDELNLIVVGTLLILSVLLNQLLTPRGRGEH
jgi:rhamnose transport system permease protein